MLEKERISRIAVSLSPRQSEPSCGAKMPKFRHSRKLVCQRAGRLSRARSAAGMITPAPLASALVPPMDQEMGRHAGTPRKTLAAQLFL